MNTARLAAHKSYKQTIDLQILATNSKSQTEFNKTAQGIINRYNRYQSAEYNTIVARARTAKQFQRFQGESNRYPNIEWIKTRSATPRELHLSYVGIILPINHSFWHQNQPGNLWNCKCDWRTTGKTATPEPERMVLPAKGLEGNPAITGELVTDKHPYYKESPKWVDRYAMLSLPDELVYINVETKYGNYLEHRLLRDAQETPENRIVASYLLEHGYKNVKLLPTIYKDEKQLRLRYYGEKFCAENSTKCPDCSADNWLIEFKSSFGNERSIKERLADAASKCDVIVLRLKNKVSTNKLDNIVKGQIKNYGNIKLVIVVNIDDVKLYK